MEKYYTDKPYGAVYSEDKKTLMIGNFELLQYNVLPETKYLAPKCWENLFLTRKITLPDGLLEIGDNAFAGCKNLMEVNIPRTVRRIGSGAFEQTKIQDVRIPEGVKVIEHDTFDGCFVLNSCLLPDSLERIEDHAFCGCYNATLFLYANKRRLNYIDPTALGQYTKFVVRYPYQKEYMEAFPHYADRFYGMDANEETMRGKIYSPEGVIVHEYELNVVKD